MKRALLLVVGVALAAILGLTWVFPHQWISPGPLSKGHATLETDCFACHAPWRGASAQQCMTCHKPADIGLRTSKGQRLPASSRDATFHQSLIEQDCMACHAGHEGPLLQRKDRQRFSHDLLRADVRARCEACHRPPQDNLHAGMKLDCGQCHQAGRWKPADFDHAKFFVLDGDHQASCTTCHASGKYKQYSCYGCHEHTPANVLAEHREEGVKVTDDCVSCHRSGEEGEGGDKD